MKSTTTFRAMLMVVVVILIHGCDDNPNRTEIRFSTTIPVLQNLTLAYTVPEGDELRGFYLGNDLSDRPLRESATFELPEQTLPKAGGEVVFCQDGERHGFGGESTLLDVIEIIGDTGAEDISDDGNCDCDTHIYAIEFNSLDLAFMIGPGHGFAPARLEGKELFCPNIPAGHLTSGDRYFDGPVVVSASVTLRVAPDRRELLADVTFRAREAE